MEPRISYILDELQSEGKILKKNLDYVGRKHSSSTAAGSPKMHNFELEKVLEKLF